MKAVQYRWTQYGQSGAKVRTTEAENFLCDVHGEIALTSVIAAVLQTALKCTLSFHS